MGVIENGVAVSIISHAILWTLLSAWELGSPVSSRVDAEAHPVPCDRRRVIGSAGSVHQAQDDGQERDLHDV